MTDGYSKWRDGLFQFSDRTLAFNAITPDTRVFSRRGMVSIGVGDREHLSASGDVWRSSDGMRASSEVHVSKTPPPHSGMVKMNYFGSTSTGRSLHFRMDMTTEEARQLAQALMSAAAAVDSEA